MNRDVKRLLAQYLTQFLTVLLPGLLAAAFLLGTPAFALTAKEKRETCQFGASHQNLTGAKQKAFMAKCMANEPAPGKGKKKKN
jgi:tellurite resistance protein